MRHEVRDPKVLHAWPTRLSVCSWFSKDTFGSWASNVSPVGCIRPGLGIDQGFHFSLLRCSPTLYSHFYYVWGWPDALWILKTLAHYIIQEPSGHWLVLGEWPDRRTAPSGQRGISVVGIVPDLSKVLTLIWADSNYWYKQEDSKNIFQGPLHTLGVALVIRCSL